MLRNKTIYELRAIAQGLGIDDLFSKDLNQLLQTIELKQKAMIPEQPVIPVNPEYDVRLLNEGSADHKDIEELLVFHVERGLRLSFPSPDQWHMRVGKKEDSGTITMPLATVLDCANKLMLKTKGI